MIAGMDRPLTTDTIWGEPFRLRPGALAAMLIPGALYLAWQHFWPDATGSHRLDGFIGILVGLFICARPARNGIDVLIFERLSLRRVMSGATGIAWLLLNAIVMASGMFLIVVGALRLTRID